MAKLIGPVLAGIMVLSVPLLVAGLPGAAFGQSSGQHLKIDRPADLAPTDAEGIYRSIIGELAGQYAISKEPTIRGYRNWRRFNTMPYRSATHGNRYVNNFANATGQAYGRFEQAGTMATGTVLAKDSFTVTADGQTYAAPLFVMEKLAAGRSPKTGDWRYLMILPDGSFFGDSTGENAAKVKFCNDCHVLKAKNDFLYFIPKAFRADAAASPTE